MAALGLVGFDNQPRVEAEEEDAAKVLEQSTERDALSRLDVLQHAGSPAVRPEECAEAATTAASQEEATQEPRVSSLSLRPPAGEEAAAPAERADDAGKKKDEAAPSEADTQRAAKTAADEAATLARHNMLGGSMERVLEAMVDQKAAPGRRVADAKRCYFNSGAAAVLSGKRGVDLYTLLLRLHTAKVVGTAGCTSHTTFDSKMTKEHPQGLAKERELRHALFAFHMADDSPDKQLVLDSLAGGA